MPSASLLVPTSVSGMVYDEEGAPVNGAEVLVESLNPSNPFQATVDVIDGAYVVNSVPAGVQVRLTASRENWTSRSRVTTLLPLGGGGGNDVNFGGPENDEDPAGPAYFISDYPEVAAVEPADDASNVPPERVTIRLTMSEAFDATNQRRLANAIHVVPGSPEAAGNQGTLDTNFLDEDEQGTVAAQPFRLSDAVYAIKDDSTFLGDEDTTAVVTWDSTGTVATLTFEAPLLAASDDALRYCVALFGGGEPIEDRQGNNLGTDETGTLNSSYGADELIYFSFREPSLSIPDGLTTDVARWRSTHENFSEFEVAEDEDDPVLTGVVVTNPTVNDAQITRISLTFSEPMVAFGGGAQGIFGSIDFLTFTFAVGETAADLDDVDLDGDNPTERFTSETIGDTSGERETEISLTNDPDAPMTIFGNPDDPKTLRIEVANPDLFADQVNAIKARAEGFEDPAGNAVTDANADQNQKVGNI